MTESKHTPGPWAVYPASAEAESWTIEDPFGRTATVYGCHNVPEYRANAHLIAAAPDLLAALEDLSEQIAAYELVHGTNSCAICPEAARAAITKARGGEA